MSFSIYLNSTTGTEVVGGVRNQIVYNFDFTNTPKHDGGYKVYMSFASELQTYVPASAIFGVVRIPDLGIVENYSPLVAFTGTRNNHVFGLIRPSQPLMDLTTSGTGTPIITTSTGRQSIDADFYDNTPVFMPYKPVNNQFTVRITTHDNVLYTYLTANYALILHFEAV